jgi:hypothetical protein
MEGLLHLFCVSKAFLKPSTALSNPLPPVFKGWGGFLAFYHLKTLPVYCFRLYIFTVSVSHLGTAATVWQVLALLYKIPLTMYS